MKHLENYQFTNYMSVFSTDIIYKLLLLEKDKEILSRTVELLQRMSTASNQEISYQQLEKNLLEQGTPKVEAFDSIVYRLSNTFMEIGTLDTIPYDKVMQFPVSDQHVKLLLTLKWISSRNRMAQQYNKTAAPITQACLDSIGTGFTVDTLTKKLEALRGELKYTREEDTLHVVLYGSLNIPTAVASQGWIQFDTSIVNSVIEKIYLQLTTSELVEN